jgi:hypothetical protein
MTNLPRPVTVKHDNPAFLQRLAERAILTEVVVWIELLCSSSNQPWRRAIEVYKKEWAFATDDGVFAVNGTNVRACFPACGHGLDELRAGKTKGRAHCRAGAWRATADYRNWLTAVVVLETLDIVLAEVCSLLDFNEGEQFIPGILDSVCCAAGNVYALPDTQERFDTIKGHFGLAPDHEPMLGSLGMSLIAQPLVCQYFDPLYLVEGGLVEHLETAPRPPLKTWRTFVSAIHTKHCNGHNP